MRQLPWPRIAVMGLVGVLLIGATGAGLTVDSTYTKLSVNGEGRSEQVAEFVSVRAATQSWSRSPSAAMARSAQEMNQLRSRLLMLGIAEADFRTADFQFRKAKDPDDNGGDRDNGYSVQHSLSVTIRNTAAAGRVMDAMVAAGAQNLSVDRGWGYSREVDPEALGKARGLAIKDAMVKANDYASALGMKVRRIVSVQDRGGYANDAPRYSRIDAASGTQIETRPQTVLASVGMEVELEK